MAIDTGKHDRFLLPRSRLDDLVAWFVERGYEVIGPALQDGAIEPARITAVSDLPIGFSDRQSPACYRLEPRQDAKVFGFGVGRHSYKRWFLPAQQRLITVRRAREGWSVSAASPEPHNFALLGAKSCDLAAIGSLDRVLGEDPHYAARRRSVLVVGTDCTSAGGTCFCASMGAGPELTDGFDLALTELLEPSHRFVTRTGSAIGLKIVAELGLAPAPRGDLEAAAAAVAHAASSMKRRLDTAYLRERLLERPEHPRWNDVALRCQACGDCTSVCPTCFCTSVEDSLDRSGTVAERVRRWDSCFATEPVPDEDGSSRSSVRARYRRWLTHKLALFWEELGAPGCVGCGRCITWCRAGIDITEEAAAIAGPERTA
jgi:sulfhydrogenase subunit beta (sulfur reductase)